ncbi:MAG: hypothetical protein NTW86_11135 [Candidatus Sumerlaeota bacterium]|nr:hypothetical protein [Candidatus Sumerlaeota bacterium]
MDKIVSMVSVEAAKRAIPCALGSRSFSHSFPLSPSAESDLIAAYQQRVDGVGRRNVSVRVFFGGRARVLDALRLLGVQLLQA